MTTNRFYLFLFAIILLTISRGHSQNILNNGDFSDSSGIVSKYDGEPPANVWLTWHGENVDAKASVVNQEFHYQIVPLVIKSMKCNSCRQGSPCYPDIPINFHLMLKQIQIELLVFFWGRMAVIGQAS